MSRVLLVKAFPTWMKSFLVSPPLGVMYLASYLREKKGHEVALVDLRLKGGIKDLEKALDAFAPRVVGVSANAVERESAHFVAGLAKEKRPGCKVVFGGAYPSCAPGNVLGDPKVDFVVQGEGEWTFARLLEALENGGDPGRVPGVSRLAGKDLVVNPSPGFIEDIDRLPLPAWDLVDLPRYWRQTRTAYLRPERYMNIFTSRGCPYRCIFCHKIFGKKTRFRSAEHVFKEMAHYRNEYGIREIQIDDDIFNSDISRLHKICDMIIDNGLKIKISLPIGLRIDLLDKLTLMKLRDAGVYFMSVAIETGNEFMQNYIKKNLDLKNAKKIISYARSIGITVNGFFMLGFPNESISQMKDTINFACESDLNFASFMAVRAFPGTKLFEIMEKNINNYYYNIPYEVPCNNLSGIDDTEFKKLFSYANIRFYGKAYNRIVRSGAYKHMDFPGGIKAFIERAF
ncbi:MAG: cobalamin-dependent protein [Deltaproteobacteria bacterium]|nr:cobalamin-dependent protein [Deltaproteobacteria bacterium]